MELGGILVYDSYAKMCGSQKLQKYYQSVPSPNLNPYILFTKEEADKQTEDLFSHQAKERDFQQEIDK